MSYWEDIVQKHQNALQLLQDDLAAKKTGRVSRRRMMESVQFIMEASEDNMTITEAELAEKLQNIGAHALSRTTKDKLRVVRKLIEEARKKKLRLSNHSLHRTAFGVHLCSF